MAQYNKSKVRSLSAVKRLNQNRSGSLLDFIEQFANGFDAHVDEY
jgi:NADH-quinone oxidoreductase subunit D